MKPETGVTKMHHSLYVHVFFQSESVAAKPYWALPNRAEFEPSSLPASEAGREREASACISQPATLLQEKNTPSWRKHSSYKVRKQSFISGFCQSVYMRSSYKAQFGCLCVNTGTNAVS